MRARSRTDEKGAILIVAVAGVVLMVIAAALSVDVGRLALEKRKNQKVADLASLDAVRNIGSASTIATQSASRNGFPVGTAGYSVTTVVGSVGVSGTFTPGVGSNAVQVTVSSPLKYAFDVGSKTVTAVAVSALRDLAGFSIGSSLVTLNTSQSTLLNAIIGPMLGGSNLGLSLVSWQGLTASTVTLRALRLKLLSAGVSVGTVNELLTTSITVRKLFQATADVLTDQGLVAQATVMNTIAAAISGATSVKLGDFLAFDQGAPDSAFDMAINALPWVTAVAEVANGNNFISVPTVSISVPNVTNTALSLQIIEKPVIKFGPVGTKATTAQVQFTITPTLNLPVAIPPIVGAKVINALPVTVTAGGADGTIEAINCGASKSMTVGVDPKQLTTSSSGTVRLTQTVLGVTTALLDVNVSSSLASTGSHTSLSFNYPAEFGPPGKHAGNATIGLSGAPYAAGSWTVLGSLPLPAATVAASVAGSLAAAMGQVDTTVVAPLLTALGIDAGSADVAALAIKCSHLDLAS